MGTRLYVGNLPFNVDEAQLRTLFQDEAREQAPRGGGFGGGRGGGGGHRRYGGWES